MIRKQKNGLIFGKIALILLKFGNHIIGYMEELTAPSKMKKLTHAAVLGQPHYKYRLTELLLCAVSILMVNYC